MHQRPPTPHCLLELKLLKVIHSPDDGAVPPSLPLCGPQKHHSYQAAFCLHAFTPLSSPLFLKLLFPTLLEARLKN